MRQVYLKTEGFQTFLQGSCGRDRREKIFSISTFFFLFVSAPKSLPLLPAANLPCESFLLCSPVKIISRHHKLTEPFVTPSFLAIVIIEIPSFLITLALSFCSYFAIYVLYHRYKYIKSNLSTKKELPTGSSSFHLLRDHDLHVGLEVMSLPRYCFSIPLIGRIVS